MHARRARSMPPRIAIAPRGDVASPAPRIAWRPTPPPRIRPERSPRGAPHSRNHEWLRSNHRCVAGCAFRDARYGWRCRSSTPHMRLPDPTHRRTHGRAPRCPIAPPSRWTHRNCCRRPSSCGGKSTSTAAACDRPVRPRTSATSTCCAAASRAPACSSSIPRRRRSRAGPCGTGGSTSPTARRASASTSRATFRIPATPAATASSRRSAISRPGRRPMRTWPARSPSSNGRHCR